MQTSREMNAGRAEEGAVRVRLEAERTKSHAPPQRALRGDR